MSASPHQPPTGPIEQSPPIPIEFSPKASKEHDAWFEARQRRLLDGERTRLGRALGAVVQSNLEEKYSLDSIRFVGLNTTKSEFLQQALAPFLLRHRELEDKGRLKDVLKTVREIQSKLEKFGIFNEISPAIEHGASTRVGNKDLDVVFHVQEAPRQYLKTSTDVGDGEGSVQALGRYRNVFGGAELLEGSISFGSRTRSAFQLRYDTPFWGEPENRVEAAIYASDTDLSHFASCTERLHGFQSKLKAVSRLGNHEFTYDAVLRRICDLGPRASMSMRESAGTNTKSAISHTLVSDTRDDAFYATRGSYYRLSQEFAGLGGDAKHVKSSIDLQQSWPLSASTSLSMGLRSGLLYNLKPSPSLFSDRFHLGGPSSVRMFRLNTLGPKDYEDWVGGDAFWAAGASVYSPIPWYSHWPVKLHAFINAGRLVAVDRTEPLRNSLKGFLEPPSTSLGFGLVYRFQIVKLEANLGVPLIAAKGDGARTGLQVGLGMTFLS